MLNSPFVREWSGRADELADRAAELTPRIIEAVLAGRGHDYLPFAGQSAGLVSDVRPAGDIVRDTVTEAMRIIDARPRARNW